MSLRVREQNDVMSLVSLIMSSIAHKIDADKWVNVPKPQKIK